MKLYVEPMDTTIVEVDDDGRVKYEKEGWSTPTLQEQRAIIYAAKTELAELTELLEILAEEAEVLEVLGVLGVLRSSGPRTSWTPVDPLDRLSTA